MRIFDKKMNVIKVFCLFIFFTIAITSCSNSGKLEREELPGFSFDRPDSWAVDTSGAKSIDTDNGRIITHKNDTIVYEYGNGVYRIMEMPKTVVPVAQRHYWDSVGLSSEVILSNSPKEDLSLNIHSKEYYVKDTVDNKEVIWVFPKKFRRGKTGAYFINPKGKDLSIYTDATRVETVDDLIALVKSVKFKREN